MTDTTHEVARARDALSGPVTRPDRQLLGAVRTGLLLVPSESPSTGPAPDARDRDHSELAVRRRSAR